MLAISYSYYQNCYCLLFHRGRHLVVQMSQDALANNGWTRALILRTTRQCLNKNSYAFIL